MKQGIEMLAYVLLGAGGLFCLSAALGIYRFRSSYIRLHAATKSLTLGAFGIISAIVLLESGWSARGKLLLIMFFFLLTNPISSYAIARAYYSGNIRHDVEGIDHE